MPIVSKGSDILGQCTSSRSNSTCFLHFHVYARNHPLFHVPIGLHSSTSHQHFQPFRAETYISVPKDQFSYSPDELGCILLMISSSSASVSNTLCSTSSFVAILSRSVTLADTFHSQIKLVYPKINITPAES